MDAAMQVGGWVGAGGGGGRLSDWVCIWCTAYRVCKPCHGLPLPYKQLDLCDLPLCMCACPQKQVSGALEAIREVLFELNERIAEQGLEAEVRPSNTEHGI